ncbi:VOC family protein [Nocardiopsis sp. NPDC050513]|uniref:VOC family protein n=1 Tax=Nocardiopsis sp. NPDC050513 TaxID=3364338 RepID=UPI0037AF7619
MPTQPPAPHLHHIALQTFDLDNCISWYQDFLGCRPTWSTDRFSDLTRDRLPGITRMAEVTVSGTRFHLFERGGPEAPDARRSAPQFQHVCMAVPSSEELRAWRTRWFEVRDSGRHTFLGSEEPTGIVVDDDLVESFYCLDVNGLEFEFSHVPEGPR